MIFCIVVLAVITVMTILAVIKKPDSVYKNQPNEWNPMQGKMVILVENPQDEENADGIIDDPGPVIFTQKRIGRDKQYFKLHKFRSMKLSTPHNVPTHMLENPDQYITRSGKFIRAHSLARGIIGTTQETQYLQGFLRTAI